MSEPTTASPQEPQGEQPPTPPASPQEPQGEQPSTPPGLQSTRPAPQAYQNPQGMRPPHQGLQPAPPRPFGGPGMNNERATPAVWVYEIAMGAVQALIGLVLVFTGNQLARFFGGGYGSSSGGDSAGVIFLLVGLALIVAGVSRPLKLR
mgnify:FL=1